METLNELISNPIVWAGFWSVIGIAVKAFCPAAIPFLGVGKKVTEELIELHNKSSVPNATIKAEAHKEGMKAAAKVLDKRLMG